MRNIKDINNKKITSADRLRVGRWYILYNNDAKMLLFRYKGCLTTDTFGIITTEVYDSACWGYSFEKYLDEDTPTFAFDNENYVVKADFDEVIKYFPNEKFR